MANSRLRKVSTRRNLTVDTRQQDRIPVIESSVQRRIVISREGRTKQGTEVQPGCMSFAIRRITRAYLGNDALECLPLLLARGHEAHQIDA